MMGINLNQHIGKIISGVFLALLFLYPQDATSATDDFNGTYELDEDASDDFMEAFDDPLQELSRLRRGVARIIINRRGGHAEEVYIQITDDTITFRSDDNDPIFFPADGEEIVHINDSGDEMKAKAELEGNRLRITMEGEDGGSVTEYHLNDDHNRLDVERKIEIGQLSDPVEFSVVYNRKG